MACVTLERPSTSMDKYSRRDFAYKVLEYEGLGYAVTSYFGRDIGDVLDAPDDELTAWWDTASVALHNIEQRLEQWCNDDADS